MAYEFTIPAPVRLQRSSQILKNVDSARKEYAELFGRIVPCNRLLLGHYDQALRWDCGALEDVAYSFTNSSETVFAGLFWMRGKKDDGTYGSVRKAQAGIKQHKFTSNQNYSKSLQHCTDLASIVHSITTGLHVVGKEPYELHLFGPSTDIDKDEYAKDILLDRFKDINYSLEKGKRIPYVV